MNRVPLWMRAMRFYAMHTPIQRGAYRAALWLYQRFPPPPGEVTTTLDRTIQITLRPHVWVDYNMYCLGAYEAPLVAFFRRSLQPASVVLDVGAYIGQYTLLAAKYAPHGAVIAFEPHPESYQRLQAHVVRNRFAHVHLLNKAAGERASVLTLSLDHEPSCSRIISASPSVNKTIEVDVISIDQVVREMSLPRVDVIKIDVEGAEGAVVRGAQETLARFRPLLIVEMDRGREQAFGDTPESLQRTLQDLGYTLYRLQRNRLAPVDGSVIDYENVIALTQR